MVVTVRNRGSTAPGYYRRVGGVLEWRWTSAHRDVGRDSDELHREPTGESRRSRSARSCGGLRRSAGDPPPRAVRGTVLLPSAIAPELRHGRRVPRFARRGSVLRSRQRAGSRHPCPVLRACGTELLQLGCRGRRRRNDRRPLPQVSHSRWPGLPGEVLLQSGRHRIARFRDGLLPSRHWNLLGPVVPGGRPDPDPARRRGDLLSHGDRLRARGPFPRLLQPLAAHDAGSLGRQHDPGRRLESGGNRAYRRE